MKRFFCFLLALGLLLSIGISASAATSAGLIYDETEQLINENTKWLGEEYLYSLAHETGVAMYIDVYTSIGDAPSLAEATKNVYVNSNFGYGEAKTGMLLALFVTPEGDSWTLNASEPFAVYGNALPTGLREALLPELVNYLTAQAWSGDLESDRLLLELIATVYANALSSFSGSELLAEPEFTMPGATALPVPQLPAEAGTPTQSYERYTPFEGAYLTDSYGLLKPNEQQQLEKLAAQVSAEHGIGVYAMIVDDFKQLNGNSEIFEANYTYYHDHNMGMGKDRDGVFLLLSMGSRDFSFFVYGEKAEYALNNWGQIELEDEFIDDFGDNRWYDGLADYAETCDEFFTLAEQGKPVREPPQSKIALASGISSFIALLASGFMWNKNKGVKKRESAYGYIAGTLVPGVREDIFINTTVTRRRIESSDSDSDSGSRSSVSHSGGGGSGRSGKF